MKRVLYTDLLHEHNRRLLDRLREMVDGSGAEMEAVSNDRMLGELPHQAKVIVRTGAFNAWGNVGLICGTESDDWFAMPGTDMPEEYRERRARMRRDR